MLTAADGDQSGAVRKEGWGSSVNIQRVVRARLFKSAVTTPLVFVQTQFNWNDSVSGLCN